MSSPDTPGKKSFELLVIPEDIRVIHAYADQLLVDSMDNELEKVSYRKPRFKYEERLWTEAAFMRTDTGYKIAYYQDSDHEVALIETTIEPYAAVYPDKPVYAGMEWVIRAQQPGAPAPEYESNDTADFRQLLEYVCGPLPEDVQSIYRFEQNIPGTN